jgi:hypothetical protein
MCVYNSYLVWRSAELGISYRFGMVGPSRTSHEATDAGCVKFEVGQVRIGVRHFAWSCPFVRSGRGR